METLDTAGARHYGGDPKPATVVVVTKGHCESVRRQQLEDFGHTHWVRHATTDYSIFARAPRGGLLAVGAEPGSVVEQALVAGRAALLEVALRGSLEMQCVAGPSTCQERCLAVAPLLDFPVASAEIQLTDVVLALR